MWLLHYSLGILSLFNCMINPLLYAFLSETLKTSEKICIGFKGCFQSFTCNFKGDLSPLNETSNSSIAQGGVYMGKDSRKETK